MIRQPIRSKKPGRQEIQSAQTLPAPVFGWNTKDPQAAMDSRYALYLQNWWPTAKTVQIRKGATDWLTGLTAQIVKTLLTWNGPSSNKLFAATDLGIYDATAGGVAGAIDSPLTNGRVESVNFNTTGGSFLVCVNGTDNLRYYNGTIWTTVANFVIGAGPSTLLTTDIVNIHAFKRGLYFIKKNSMSFFYLPIDQILGTVSEFPLGGIFTKGGRLIAQGSWTIDGGAGVDDLTVFVTSEGQLAVYKGTDPGSAATWALVGVYDIARPLGPRCFMKYGGDLLYLSYAGCVGLSTYLQSVAIDRARAITENIAEAFTDASANYGSNIGWEFANSPNDDLLLVNVPISQYLTSQQYAMNMNTGAWCNFSGWNAFSWALFNNTLYMGMAGKVAKAWQGGGDFGGIISCYAKQAPVYFNPRARLKQVSMLQPIFKLGGRVAVDVAIDNDFAENESYGPAVFAPVPNSRFDTAQWDTAVWGQLATTRIDWITVADGMGYAKALRLRVLAQDATVEWSATNVLYEAGALQG